MWQLFALIIFGTTTAAAARGIYVLADSPLALALLEDQHPQQLPPQPQPQPQQPDYEIPHQWGGPIPSELLDVAIATDDRPRYPDPPDPGDVLPGELQPSPQAPTAPAPENPVTASGSAQSGNNRTATEPQQNRRRTAAEPTDYSRVIDLLELCPLPVCGPFTPDEWELFTALKAAGRNQGQIIKTMWGISKNGSSKYQQARDRYIALAETWHQIQKLENKS